MFAKTALKIAFDTDQCTAENFLCPLAVNTLPTIIANGVNFVDTFSFVC